jgi:hypothetical protein
MKHNKDFLVNELFSDARQQTAKISFVDTAKHLQKSVNVSSDVAKKWYSKLFKLNSIIMVSTVIVSSIVFFTLNNQQANNVLVGDEVVNQKAQTNNIENQLFTEINRVKNQGKVQNNSRFFKKNNAIVEAKITIDYIDSVEELSEINYPKEDIKLTTETVSRVNTSKIDSTYKVIRYTITEKTSLEELNKIQKQAESVGIVFSCKVKHRRGYIKLIRLKMLIVNAKGKKRVSQFYCKGSAKSKFKYEIKWGIDSKGNVIDFAGNGCAVNVKT